MYKSWKTFESLSFVWKGFLVKRPSRILTKQFSVLLALYFAV